MNELYLDNMARVTRRQLFGSLAGGVGAARLTGLPILGTAWIALSIAAFSISGLSFVFRVGPLQRTLAEKAERGSAGGGFNLEAHRREASRWAWWAHASLISAAVSVPLMIMKPECSQ